MTLERFLERFEEVVRVRVALVQGSSPREAGAEMYVLMGGMYGTIGGGQLEYMALDRARQMLAAGQDHTVMNVPLGPEIGQCCGGRVELVLERMDAEARARALDAEAALQAARPEVLIFGAGHVGRALAHALTLLPVRAGLIDSRKAELALASCEDKRLTPLPESEVRKAGAGAAYVIATHDHALDFLLAAEALSRKDAAYVGMIGSATKRARFASWARTHAVGADAERLICPMGAAGLGDKRPEVIAAHVAAELMTAIAAHKTIRKGMEADA